MKVLHKSK